jgi:hypothetical protein
VSAQFFFLPLSVVVHELSSPSALRAVAALSPRGAVAGERAD